MDINFIYYAHRPCVLYSDNMVQNSAQVANDLSKCSIKEVERPQVDRNCNIPLARVPIQVPQSIQGETERSYAISFTCMLLYFSTCEI